MTTDNVTPEAGLYIHNTLTKRVEPFVPIHGHTVNLFVCGPTVYDYAHLGNAKTYTQFDFIARYLRRKGYKVFYLQNITDIDDKIIRAAAKRNVTWKELALQFEKIYRDDMAALGNTAVDTYARATDHIAQIVKQVEELMFKGYAYEISTGIYYEIGRFADYGKLSGRQHLEPEDSVSRIDEDAEKRGPNDFCLWKRPKEGEPTWETSIGPGRPGWHIEDTAITEAFFGPQYDIHGGAVDLIFPHHEAEIAQMEAASGKEPLVRYWLHTGFLNTGSKKMSKSEGELRTIRSALERFDYRVLRFYFLSNHYRSSLAFSDEIIEQAEGAVRRLEEFAFRVDPDYDDADDADTVGQLTQQIYAALDDDFNTPVAFARLFEFIRYQNTAKRRTGRRTYRMLAELNGLFDVFRMSQSDGDEEIEEIEALIRQRNEYRRKREFARADDVRDLLLAKGVQVYDSPTGATWRRIR